MSNKDDVFDTINSFGSVGIKKNRLKKKICNGKFRKCIGRVDK